MTWKSRGDFSKPYDAGATSALNRSVEYTNSDSAAYIQKIVLCGYRHGGLRISAKYNEGREYEPLREALYAEGLALRNELVTILRSIGVNTDDKQVIGIFLRALTRAESSVALLTPLISHSLGVQFDRNYPTPHWLIGSMDEGVMYVNTAKESKVANVTLMAFKDGTFKLSIQANDSFEKTKLAAALELHQIEFTEDSFTYDRTLYVHANDSNKKLIVAALHALGPVESEFTELVPLVSNYLGVELHLQNKSRALCEHLQGKCRVHASVIFSRVIPYLTVREQCRLHELCADDALKAQRSVTQAHSRPARAWGRSNKPANG